MESVLVVDQTIKNSDNILVTSTSDNVGTETNAPCFTISNGRQFIGLDALRRPNDELEKDILGDPGDMTHESGNILHLQIESHDVNPEIIGGEEKEGTQVFFVYQDVHTCGICQRQYFDIVEFIAHKSEHTIGKNLYKCELCKFILLDHVALLKHYNDLHGMKSFNSMCDVASKDDAELPVSETIDMLNTTCQEKEKFIEGTNDETTFQNDENSPLCAPAEQCESKIQCVIKGKSQLLTSGGERSHRHVTGKGRLMPAGLRKKQNLRRLKRNITEDETHEHSSALSVDSSTNYQLIEEGKVVNESAFSDQDATVKNGDSERSPSEDNHSAVPPYRSNSTRKDFSFVLLTEVVKGNTFTYGRVWFKCLHCDFKTRSKLGLTNHMTDAHESLLDAHEDLEIKPNSSRPHDKTKIMRMSTYETQHCEERRVRRKKRQRTVERQDVPGAYPCNTCGKIFSRIRYLRKHQETHRTERKFVCEECGKPFKSRTYLRVHKQVHQNKVFNCNQCSFSSGTKAAIHAHRQIHSQGSAICDVCGYAYIDKSTLNKHKRVHDSNRPYACSYSGCTWRFKTEVMCKAHIRAHTTEGKFRCAYCGYVFRHKHHLKRHESNMHGVIDTGQDAQPGGSPGMEHDDEKSMDNINVVISSEIPADQLHLPPDLGSAHLVVATDTNGAPIAYETDISTFCNATYQTLSGHSDDGQDVEGQVDDQTILVTGASADTHHAIIFHQD